jgi:N-acetylglucosaminyl-diphospho-decaprenol L-rhamnosyltransferase
MVTSSPPHYKYELPPLIYSIVALSSPSVVSLGFYPFPGTPPRPAVSVGTESRRAKGEAPAKSVRQLLLRINRPPAGICYNQRPSPAMRFSLIIVHHNAHAYLKSCLHSVQKAGTGLSMETIVVDNASENMPALTQEHPQALWLLNKDNVGWGAAINQAAAKSSGEILVFLNPDAELLPDSLQKLHDFFSQKAQEHMGPVGGKLLFSDGKTQPSCGPFPCLAGMLWRRLLPPTRRKYYFRLPDRDACPADWVTGAFMALRRSVFEELGGFDSDFFLYYEDVDLCIRARQKAYPTYYLPGAAAYHHHPHAARARRDPELERILQASRLLYFRKHRPAWEAWTLKKYSTYEFTWK